MTRTAVVLFNLGGPDNLKAVKPFLFNLFYDPAIINLPNPFRYMLAQFISTMRAGKAKGIYQKMGGKSPILPQTVAQAEALEQKLSSQPGDYKVFTSMRYWHPMSKVVAKKVKAYNPDYIILLPLYPQFSTTTTGSSFNDWRKSCQKIGLDKPTSSICCYATDNHFIAAHTRIIRDMYWKAAAEDKPRILFSAHGLPEKIIEAGDPYQMQIEKTTQAIVQLLSIDELDYAVCYQSRVGRLKWIGPSTEEEIERAGKDKKPVLVVPIAFVSEHSETLVELDIDYRRLAEEKNVPSYWRVPALATDSLFIDTLEQLCLGVDKPDAQKDETVCPSGKIRFCPGSFSQCACGV
jgi:protoporphyrin/coproporphyrin ferrochelatase